MPKTRRSFKDYEPEVDRFEEFVEVTEDKNLVDIRDVDELVDHLENWFKEIEIPSTQWAAFARSMVAWMVDKGVFSPRMREPVRVIKIKRKIQFIRSREKWTKREAGLLRFRYQRPERFTVRQIARDLGRSERSIYNKVWKLRIRREEEER